MSPQVMRGLILMKAHFDDDGHDWSKGTDMADFETAMEWIGDSELRSIIGNCTSNECAIRRRCTYPTCCRRTDREPDAKAGEFDRVQDPSGYWYQKVAEVTPGTDGSIVARGPGGVTLRANIERAHNAYRAASGLLDLGDFVKDEEP